MVEKLPSINPLQMPFALEHQLITGLIRNRETIEIWTKRKKEHQELYDNLQMYSKRMKHQIFAPLGKKAMMKSHLIHTNEILVSLGQNWFVKVSSRDAEDICRRRIDECDLMLGKCQAERNLYESRRDLKLRDEAFGGKEIVEPFDENEEAKWKEEHKDKVKRHKKELAQIKGQLKQSTTETEEDLWKHLDMLELQEELEDELTRLGEDEDDLESEDSSEVDDEESTAEDEETTVDEEPKEKRRNGQKKGVTFDLESTSVVSPEPGDVEIIKTTAIKEEIVESTPLNAFAPVKSTRPESKFKKSRHNNPD